jgi:hypothetical protein
MAAFPAARGQGTLLLALLLPRRHAGLGIIPATSRDGRELENVRILRP